MRYSPLGIAAILAFAATSAHGDSMTFHQVVPGDQLGRLLQCLGHRKLWGEKGIVRKAVALNPANLVRRNGDLIVPRHRLQLPLPPGAEPLAEEAVLRCARRPANERYVAVEPTREPQESARTEVSDQQEAPARTLTKKSTKAVPIEVATTPTDEENTTTSQWVPTPIAPEKTPVAATPPSLDPTPSPTALPETPSPRQESPRSSDIEGLAHPWRVGGYLGHFHFSSSIPNGGGAYSRTGLGATVGRDFVVDASLRIAVDGSLLLLSAGGNDDAVRPVDLRAVLSYAPEQRSAVWRAFAGATYTSMLGLTTSGGYRDLVGATVGAEGIDASGFGGNASATLLSSGTSAVTLGNFRFDATAAYHSSRCFDEDRWSAGLGVQWTRLGTFPIGTATIPAFRLFYQRRF